jgi:hypothetical protein
MSMLNPSASAAYEVYCAVGYVSSFIAENNLQVPLLNFRWSRCILVADDRFQLSAILQMVNLQPKLRQKDFMHTTTMKEMRECMFIHWFYYEDH